MKPAIINGKKIYFDVFIAHADPSFYCQVLRLPVKGFQRSTTLGGFP